MSNITIRRLPDNIKLAIQKAAIENKRSMEEEVRIRLASSIAYDSADSLGNKITENTVSEASPKDVAENESLRGKKILLIIGGGIAAYKSLDLIRRLRDRKAEVKVILTSSAQKFITALSAAALSANKVYKDLFSDEESESVQHITLARWPDLVVVAPATANRIAKMANGLCDDLAGSITLATRAPILLAPAMNPAMWSNASTQSNYNILLERGYHSIGPEIGEMAEANEAGCGRMSEVLNIVDYINRLLNPNALLLKGKKIIITAGPTQEPIDPVRYLGNRSSGLQGYSLAHSLAELGAEVHLISGPVSIAAPAGVNLKKVNTAEEMQLTLSRELPADCVIMSAAVADWRIKELSDRKLKKQGAKELTLEFVPTPDILSELGNSKDKPRLLIGFAAETDNILDYAQRKLETKGADWIIANDVSVQADGSCVMGGSSNKINIITKDSCEEWQMMDKKQLSKLLAKKIADTLSVY